MKLIFYISGHGYGHAVRDIEIIQSLLQRVPDADIHFRTTAPTWLFGPLLTERVRYHNRELDFGVQQKNSFSADKKATFVKYAQLVQEKQKLMSTEVEFLKQVQPDIILSDITPIAFDAAANYGRKAIAVGNFSWDWIYTAYLEDYPEYTWIVEDIQMSYAKSTELWRIPFYGDMSVFPNAQDVPLVARHAQHTPSETRAKLGIKHEASHKYVLLGLRMSDLIDVDWRRVEALQDITFVAVSRDVTLQNCIHLQEADVQFVDVLNACDAVLSKPGYSMVAEVLANRTPIVYVPRKDFVEDPVLINGLKDFGVCEELSQQDFYAGQWEQTFLELFTKPQTWQPLRTNGADRIAAKILDSI